jgi:murein endopeptidase
MSSRVLGSKNLTQRIARLSERCKLRSWNSFVSDLSMPRGVADQIKHFAHFERFDTENNDA